MPNETTADDLPTVHQWERDTPDAETPDCPACGAHFLGVLPAFLSANGLRVWMCDSCDWRSA